MTSPTGTPACDALIVVDMQTAFVHRPGEHSGSSGSSGASGTDAVPGAAQLLDRVGELLDRARAAGAVVVHLQNDGPPGADDDPGTPGWELYLQVKPGPREHVIRKPRDDGFDATPLGEVLVSAGVRSLAICGVMSEMCVQATAKTALARGYRVVLPFDAHGTYDVPAVPGVADKIPAHVVSRVAAWALGDQPDITSPTSSVIF
ncbi:isochorismatase family protein [Kribbella shirazensis]|uniref:Nicotinamidase-related amidase n=1 Tax=Kribbella shirazensis TaxID=1105143 RepID=A0A7X5VGZ2_9ACTN|nr:isochorismatase family protein [Kribbella shirazensis]NIK61015.1 nicotinamidase-related amidase [Kribbella shirazensis]